MTDLPIRTAIPEREPLPWDHPRVRALRAIDAAFWAGVAVQERITGKPYPECFSPLVEQGGDNTMPADSLSPADPPPLPSEDSAA